MSMVAVLESTLTNIANAIRAKTGTSKTYKPSEMPNAISAISGGGITPTGTINIVQNGTVDVTNYASADVAVPTGITPTGSQTFTANGTYDVTNIAEAVVNVETGGGGGGGLTLLDTIGVNGVNGVRVDIDATWFDTYDYVAMVPNLTFSKSDWVYLVQDTTTGGQYISTVTSSIGTQQSLFLGKSGSKFQGAWFRGAQSPQPYIFASYLYLYLYTASTTMTGTIKIYGIKAT